MSIWRELNLTEQKEFRQWARDNFDAEVDTINETWHPVVRDECLKMVHELNAEDYIRLNFSYYEICGIATIKFWGGGHGQVQMTPIILDKLPDDLKTIEYNDGQFGCERIDEIEIDIYKVYEGYHVQIDSTIVSLYEYSKGKRGIE